MPANLSFIILMGPSEAFPRRSGMDGRVVNFIEHGEYPNGVAQNRSSLHTRILPLATYGNWRYNNMNYSISRLSCFRSIFFAPRCSPSELSKRSTVYGYSTNVGERVVVVLLYTIFDTYILDETDYISLTYYLYAIQFEQI